MSTQIESRYTVPPQAYVHVWRFTDNGQSSNDLYIPREMQIVSTKTRDLDITDPKDLAELRRGNSRVQGEKPHARLVIDTKVTEKFHPDIQISRYLSENNFAYTGQINAAYESFFPGHQFGGVVSIVHLYPHLYRSPLLACTQPSIPLDIAKKFLTTIHSEIDPNKIKADLHNGKFRNINPKELNILRDVVGKLTSCETSNYRQTPIALLNKEGDENQITSAKFLLETKAVLGHYKNGDQPIHIVAPQDTGQRFTSILTLEQAVAQLIINWPTQQS